MVSSGVGWGGARLCRTVFVADGSDFLESCCLADKPPIRPQPVFTFMCGLSIQDVTDDLILLHTF